MASAPRTPECMDDLLLKMQQSLDAMAAAHDSQVKLRAAELDLLGKIEVARDFALDTLKNKTDRTLLQAVFGGDCHRIARLQAICECTEFSEMNRSDQRIKMCMNACESVDKVLEDLGLGEILRRAREKERDQILAEDDGTTDMCIQHLASASIAEREAFNLEHGGNIQEASEKYEKCERELAAAMQTAIPEDVPVLQGHIQQIQRRVSLLQELPAEEAKALKPPEEDIEPVDLQMTHNQQKNRKLMATCSAMGAAGGLLVLGPVGLLLGGVVGAHAATREDTVGDAARSAGGVTYDAAKSTGLTSTFKQGMKHLQGLDEYIGASEVLMDGITATSDAVIRLDGKIGASDALKAGIDATSDAVKKLDEKVGAYDALNAGIAGASDVVKKLDEKTGASDALKAGMAGASDAVDGASKRVRALTGHESAKDEA